jgi:hypothetical protein
MGSLCLTKLVLAQRGGGGVQRKPSDDGQLGSFPDGRVSYTFALYPVQTIPCATSYEGGDCKKASSEICVAAGN